MKMGMAEEHDNSNIEKASAEAFCASNGHSDQTMPIRYPVVY